MEKFNDFIKKKLMEDCELSEEQIENMSKKEVLDEIFRYEGFLGYTDWILWMIEEIYGVSFNEDDYDLSEN